METTIANVDWAECGTCGGELPTIDGDNGHRDLPPSRAECPRTRSPGGLCGCYRDGVVEQWLKDLRGAAR